MNLQDLIAYCLMGLAVVCFAYLVWASRQRTGTRDESKKK